MQKLPLLPTRGWLFWKQEWYSICSAHLRHDPTCPRCTTGTWINVWGGAIMSFFHNYIYWFWYWIVNLNKNKKFSKIK